MDLTLTLLWITFLLLVALILTPLRFVILKRDADRLFAMQIEATARRQAEASGLLRDQLKGAIVFVGDSLTQEYATSEYFFGKPVVNRGISSDTTRGVLSRIQESVVDLKPSLVLLHIGTNDLAAGYSDREILGNIQLILQCLKQEAPQAELRLVSLYPVNRTDFTDIFSRVATWKRPNERIRHLNQELAKLAESLEVGFLDVAPFLLDHKGELRKDYSVEGLHLTGKAYRKITEVLKSQEPRLA